MTGQHYLTRDEYLAQKPNWFPQDAWVVWATELSSPKFKEKSEKNRANRCSDKFKPHRGGSNSIATMRQKLVSVQLLFFWLIHSFVGSTQLIWLTI
jgi:hypothetical protein